MSKIEIETELHLLKTEVLLTDGSKGRVFVRGNRNEAGLFTYTCRVCNVFKLPGETCLQTHIQGRRHQTKMAQPAHDPADFVAPPKKMAKFPMDIAPGEPVPPGFENEVKQLARIQSTLDIHKKTPLVALEYVMELIHSNDETTEPNYHCVLCDKRGDPRTIINHLTSFNHRTKYLEKHFPTTLREIGPIRFNKEAHKRKIVQELIENVCRTIEDFHGRLTPSVHLVNDYEKNHQKYLQEVIFDKHFDERMGPNFKDAVDKKVIDLFFASIEAEEKKTQQPKIETRSLSNNPENPNTKPQKKDENVIEIMSDISDISSDSDKGHSSRRSPKRRRNDLRFKIRKGIKSRSRSPPSFRNKRRSRSRSPFRRDSRSPQQNTNKPRVKLNHLETLNEKTPFDKDKSNAMKCREEINRAVELLTRMFKEYQKNPEKHPEYNDEWKKFWNKRYKEVQAEEKDPSTYDYKPEWIEFWTRRMKELHDKDIDRKVFDIKNKYKPQSSMSNINKRVNIFDNDEKSRKSFRYVRIFWKYIYLTLLFY